MGISPEGVKLIVTGIAVAAAGGVISVWVKWLGVPALVLGFVFSAFSAYFFRDPERDKVFPPGEIACPADGTVMSVGVEDNPDVTVVRIFLSIFNVHIQRAPANAKVESVKYSKGSFAVAYKPEAAKNERNLMRFSDSSGRKFAVEQITGSIARRIACYVREGEEVKTSQKIGMIYFGSQVAVYLPGSARVLVKPGDKVAGGETILGLW
ncbi:MAG TPA: phosphatidylserine decarboxylase family protein [Elusimicrobia bacterium]|nr:phosphatidylserine decarboxylase family protein [Elusimicrobiota bacterium]